jgi:predicted O-methyltransferase YrrM
MLPMALHMNELWETWGRLTDAVTLGKNPDWALPSQKSEKSRNAFIGAMHVVGKRLSMEIAEALDLSPYHKLLDIGGASGTYTIAFLEKNPNMKAVIFDLKSVIPFAEERLKAAGVANRVECVGGDFYTDELPEGCDLALLSAIIHQNSPEQNLELYRKIHRALAPGGTIMIRDHIMDESRTRPPAGAMFAINMLVATEGGDTYTFKEIKECLKQAGFEDIGKIRHGERMDGIVTARKPI